MTKDTLRTITEIEKAQRTLSVFVFFKDGNICGRLTARNIKKSNTTHVAFIIYAPFTHGEEIASYERVSGLGFNRQSFAIDYVLANLQERLNEEFGIVLTGDVMRIEHWIQDFSRAGIQVIQAL